MAIHETNPSDLPHFTKETLTVLPDEAFRAEIFMHYMYLGKSETAGLSSLHIFA